MFVYKAKIHFKILYFVLSKCPFSLTLYMSNESSGCHGPFNSTKTKKNPQLCQLILTEHYERAKGKEEERKSSVHSTVDIPLHTPTQFKK